jgi:hypothetical protein
MYAEAADAYEKYLEFRRHPEGYVQDGVGTPRFRRRPGRSHRRVSRSDHPPSNNVDSLR